MVLTAANNRLQRLSLLLFQQQQQRGITRGCTIFETLCAERCFNNNNSNNDIKIGTFLSSINEQQKRMYTSTKYVSSINQEKQWKVYLSGEIHSDWRHVIIKGCEESNIPVTFTSPNISHEDSDDCGAIILGMEKERHNWDMISAKMNAIRTKTLLQESDIVIVRFGDKYRQWNAAMDVGMAYAYGKSLIIVHPPNLSHMLKEVNATANVVCEHPEQVVQTLAYVVNGTLPTIPKDGDSYIPIADRLGKGNPNP